MSVILVEGDCVTTTRKRSCGKVMFSDMFVGGVPSLAGGAMKGGGGSVKKHPLPSVNKRAERILLECILVTACKRSLGQGNIFRSVCQEFCSQGEGWYPSLACLQAHTQGVAGLQAHTQGES